MAWPKSTDYSEAIQNAHLHLGDAELRAGELAHTPLGLPMLWSGNFADVYKIHCPATGNTWALKCFTREVPEQQTRYRSIATHLEQARLPFTVDFQYLEQGIRVAGAWFPALKMRWVEGLTLNQFVEEHLRRPANLKMLLDLWVKLAERLRKTETAHADLQHGNVLLVPMTGGQLALRLIDYDGMFVPLLAGRRSGEVGHPAYQHPERLRAGSYNLDVDRFSHLTIYCAVRCLMVGQHDLWQQFNNGDNLLFREADFQRPSASKVFHALWGIRDASARALVGRLVLACQAPFGQTPLLQDVVVNGEVLPLTGEMEAEVESVLASDESTRLSTKSSSIRSAAPQRHDAQQQWWLASPATISTSQPVTPTWDAVDRYIQGFGNGPAPPVLEDGERLALAVDRENGLERFAQLALRRWSDLVRYRHLLEARAAIHGHSVCGACYSFVPSPFLPAVAEVEIIGSESVHSDAITIEYSSGLWSEVKIEGREIPWDGPEPAASISRRGALTVAVALTLGPLLLLIPLCFMLGVSIAPLLSIFGFITATAIGGIAIFFHPRILPAVDTAWDVVVPHLLKNGPTRPVAAFIAGLAKATVKKGSRNRRKAVLEQAIVNYRRLVEDRQLSCQYLGPLYRLAILDQLHRFGGAIAAVKLFAQVLHACVMRQVPLDCMEMAADDARLMGHLTDEARMLFRYYASMSCYHAGYSVADVLTLKQRSRTLRLFLHSLTDNLVAYWFAILKLFPSGREAATLTTVFDLASRDQSRLMVEMPDVLAVSDNEDVKICSGGVFYNGTLFESPIHTEIVAVQEFVQTGWTHQRRDGGADLRFRNNPPVGYMRTIGYSLLVNGVKVSHSRNPAPVAAELEKCSEMFFKKIRPAAKAMMQHQPSGRLPHPEMAHVTTCPVCAEKILFKEGRVGEMISLGSSPQHER